ncbi:hypothetical protein BO99DRAFT_118983 [Aspergillus violaceofuscus CBS 115571]|uniref:Uncharacterized protein n=1 Tax=Aspergillus violaceofuscus (strain CBS 115571) TaxID=1450538 RepID=A0A2V5H785_ASPV1|nr:hypothetical protein BO99DRAFT_118983 [Aspergillus violaceofuscus CBS 115571]
MFFSLVLFMNSFPLISRSFYSFPNPPPFPSSYRAVTLSNLLFFFFFFFYFLPLLLPYVHQVFLSQISRKQLLDQRLAISPFLRVLIICTVQPTAHRATVRRLNSSAQALSGIISSLLISLVRVSTPVNEGNRA